MLELTANFLGPFCAGLKPLYKKSADAGVQTLYLHAAVAHVRAQLGKNRSPVAYVADDNVEAHLRSAARYIQKRANNAPRAQLFTDMVSISPVTLTSPDTERKHLATQIYTTRFEYCTCMAELIPTQEDDFATVLSMATADPPQFEYRADAKGAIISLPLASVVQQNINENITTRKQNDDNALRPSRLRTALSCQLSTICLGWCGDRSGGTPSSVALAALVAYIAEEDMLADKLASVRRSEADLSALQSDRQAAGRRLL